MGMFESGSADLGYSWDRAGIKSHVINVDPDQSNLSELTAQEDSSFVTFSISRLVKTCGFSLGIDSLGQERECFNALL